MNSRERVKQAVRFQQPDRAPISHAVLPAGLRRLMDDLLAFNLRWIAKWTRREYDGLHFADDWGAQTSLLINPEQWRRLFKPRYAEMFKRVRDAGMDVWFHSDGRINAIIPDLIDIGVQVLNCQVAVVGHDWIAHHARGKVAVRRLSIGYHVEQLARRIIPEL